MGWEDIGEKREEAHSLFAEVDLLALSRAQVRTKGIKINKNFMHQFLISSGTKYLPLDPSYIN